MRRSLLIPVALLLTSLAASTAEAQEETFRDIERQWRAESADGIARYFADEVVINLEGHRDGRIRRGRATNVLRQYFNSIDVASFEIERMKGSMCFYRHEYDRSGRRVRGSISVQLDGNGRISQIWE